MRSKRVLAELKNKIHRKCGWLAPNATWIECSRRKRKSIAQIMRHHQFSHNFTYILSCLDRTTCLGSKVKAVRFCISRDWQVWHTLQFPRRLTRMEAVIEAEKYLSKPLDQLYFQRIEKHSFMYKNWKEAHNLYKTRGDALSNAKFLESMNVYSNDVLTIECGS